MSFELKASRNWPFHVSSGGAVYRITAERREYLLLHRAPRTPAAPETWHLPKGTLRRDETLEQCAVREIGEESGRDAEVEGYLGALQSRWTDDRGRLIDKTVHYFICRDIGPNSCGMDDEHDRVDWEPSDEAQRKLDREPKREAEIVRRADAFLNGAEGSPRRVLL